MRCARRIAMLCGIVGMGCGSDSPSSPTDGGTDATELGSVNRSPRRAREVILE